MNKLIQDGSSRVLGGRLNLVQVNKDKAQQVKTELIHQEVVKIATNLELFRSLAHREKMAVKKLQMQFEVKTKIEGLSRDVGD